MSPEASAVWMWVAINVSFLTIVFAALWWDEMRECRKILKKWEGCVEILKSVEQERSVLHDANVKLMERVYGKDWKHES